MSLFKKKIFPVDNHNEFAILNKQLVMINYDYLGDQVIFTKIQTVIYLLSTSFQQYFKKIILWTIKKFRQEFTYE